MLEKIIVCEQQVITHDITTIDNFMNKRYRIKLFSPILKPGLKWHALKVNGSTLESVYAPHFVVNDTEGLTYHETPAGAFYTMPAKYVPEDVKDRIMEFLGIKNGTAKEFEKLLKEKQIVFRPDEMEFKLGRKTIEDYFMVFFGFPTVSARTMFVGNPASQLALDLEGPVTLTKIGNERAVFSEFNIMDSKEGLRVAKTIDVIKRLNEVLNVSEEVTISNPEDGEVPVTVRFRLAKGAFLFFVVIDEILVQDVSFTHVRYYQDATRKSDGAVVKERVDVKLSELGFLVVDDLYQYTTERDFGKNIKTAISNLVKRMMVYLTMSVFQRDGMLIGECGLTVRDSTEYAEMFRIDNLEFFLFEHL